MSSQIYKQRKRRTNLYVLHFLNHFIIFSKLFRNTDEFPDYLQISRPTFKIPVFFETFQTCRNHVIRL